MTWIRGRSGWIVVDTLTSKETAAAAVALARRHLGDAPVVAVILTHSHARSLRRHRRRADATNSSATVRVRIVAPRGFIEEATSENVIAGIAMGRRAGFMYGTNLPRGARGHVDTGLGKGPARGTIGLVRPTDLVDHTPQEMEIDGVRFIFQYAPDSEAPAELTFYLPGPQGLLRRRGGQPHPAQPLHAARREGARRAALERLHRPGAGAVRRRRGGVRQPSLADLGQRARRRVPEAAARRLSLHPRPDDAPGERRLHPARDRRAARAAGGAAQRLRGARLLRHRAPQRQGASTRPTSAGSTATRPISIRCLRPRTGARYVEAMGGADAVREQAERAYARGDYRWAATLLDHLVFAAPGRRRARELLARTYDQLGYRAESGPWRDVYLSGAHELRHGCRQRRVRSGGGRRAAAPHAAGASCSRRWRRGSTVPRRTGRR